MATTEKTRSPRKIRNEADNSKRHADNEAFVKQHSIVSHKRPSKAIRQHIRALVRAERERAEKAALSA